MKLTKWILASALAGTLTAQAYRPAGWLYVVFPYAYDLTLRTVVFFNPEDTQIQQCYEYPPGSGWQSFRASSLVGGLSHYGSWPAVFDRETGRVFNLAAPHGQWCLVLSEASWSLFGEPSTPGALIPAGSFVMGATTNVGHESEANELPQHTVYTDAFYMDPFEVTKMFWDDVAKWAGTHGYDISASSGDGKAVTHPVYNVSWYECVKWCNARSEKAGLTPCYTVGGNVYRTGNSVPVCNWAANGYRLPTEAEWEKAARGGAANHRFPWTATDTIQHARANYLSLSSYAFDTSPTPGNHPAFDSEPAPYTSPAGYFSQNTYGLYDMAGNEREWCWDWYSSSYYSTSPHGLGFQYNPHGPSVAGTDRVLRGGSWANDGYSARCATRKYRNPTLEDSVISFRCVKRQ